MSCLFVMTPSSIRAVKKLVINVFGSGSICLEDSLRRSARISARCPGWTVRARAGSSGRAQLFIRL